MKKRYIVKDCGNLGRDSDEGRYRGDLHWGIWDRKEESWIGYYNFPAHPGAGTLCFGTIREAKEYIRKK